MRNFTPGFSLKWANQVEYRVFSFAVAETPTPEAESQDVEVLSPHQENMAVAAMLGQDLE